MSSSVKVTLYALLVLIASVSGYFALTTFGAMMSRAGERTSELESIEPERRPAVEAEPASATNNEATNQVIGATNTLTDLTNVPPGAVATNTNTVTLAETNSAATSLTASAEAPAATTTQKTRPQPIGSNHLGLWTALFLGSLIGLGFLIASDVSHYLGNRTLKALYNDEGEGQQNPEYDKAEEMWASGNHLEAVKMMREYLAANPREQHVAIRIAEIYEKDLKNNLAAALEYEEVLKHKLPAERWGWAAIHLCNLYFRLNQEQKGFTLLRRIVNEYPNTAAAEKARTRLEQVDGSIPSEPMPDAPASTALREQPPAAGPATNLPPGFRPKK